MSSTNTNENPLRQGIRLERTAEPCVVVIFGASGDLTKRKLVPALYRLSQERLLPAEFAIIGVARRETSNEDFRKNMRDSVAQFSESKRVDDAVWESFSKGLYYLPSSFDDPEGYKKLSALLEQVDKERNTAGNRVFYLSTSPDSFPVIIDQLGNAGLAKPKDGSFTRVIIEKPFGH